MKPYVALTLVEREVKRLREEGGAHHLGTNLFAGGTARRFAVVVKATCLLAREAAGDPTFADYDKIRAGLVHLAATAMLWLEALPESREGE